ncbi:cell wall-active antibiotics response protein LiaF [Enterococcus sp. CSURQ0835]|uniref:cell wall-active antibiotics response protein LiaF n=1 Tax=Enterococcus sp. CSURQ0835 TaxID=2681394 RepID=UPI00135B154F|nr:cell wall-active antibiotics response protein LiaF [Enterococcus sp. CSURQ0835]
MKNPWRFFIVIELLLLVFVMWQLSQTPGLLVILVIGGANIYWALKKDRHRRFQLVAGLVMATVALITSPAVWLMIVFAILFIGLKGVEIAGISVPDHSFKTKKQMVMVETEEPLKHAGERKKQSWFGNERIGSQVYEWDDINLTMLAGDTIVDLGNTLLPKEDSVVIIRKGFGRTRVLIPYGIGVVIEHATFYGKVVFEDDAVTLKNETLKLYSHDYDESPRRLKLVTNALIGDIEVIRV